MTRMSTFTEEETITVTPLRTFPVMRDLVTDVSFNYEKAREVQAFAPPADLQPGDYRMQQVDVARSQEFRKCIECFLCQDVCHVVRDHEDNKHAFAGPRFLMRVAELDMHPLDDGRPPRRRHGASTGWATATSPSAAPRSAPSTSRSPTTRSSRSRSASSTVTTIPSCGWATRSDDAAAEPRSFFAERRPRRRAGPAGLHRSSTRASPCGSPRWRRMPGRPTRGRTPSGVPPRAPR